MKDTAMKHLKDSSKHAAPSPSASTKSCWKTIKLPLASTLMRPDDENNIVDMDGNIVLKLRGGITRDYLKI